MKICQLTNSTEKQAVTRSILEALPEWFGIPEAREDYITESGDKQFFCAYDADKPVGFLYLKETAGSGSAGNLRRMAGSAGKRSAASSRTAEKIEL